MTRHFPSWSRMVYIQWSQYQKINIFADHIDKILDVFIHSALFLEDPLHGKHGAVPQKLRLQKASTTTSKVPRSPTGAGPGVHKDREQQLGKVFSSGDIWAQSRKMSRCSSGPGGRKWGRRPGDSKQQDAFQLLPCLQAAGKEGRGAQDSRSGGQRRVNIVP